VLVFVHEFGHFIVAKKSGIRVDEFAIGFPPKIFSFMKNGTKYALNLIPFGGYVKIFGETPDEESSNPSATDSFVNKSKLTQASVLIAGIVFNIIFAWVLFSISFMTGFPSVVTEDTRDSISDVNVVITSVLEDSPASDAGLQAGDNVLSLSSNLPDKANNLSGDLAIEDIQNFVNLYGSNEIIVTYDRSGETLETSLTPEAGLIEGRNAIGISMDMIGNLQLPIHEAIARGFTTTGSMIKNITVGLITFLGQTFTGKADLNQVAGPVGIVGLVGDATQFGFVYLLGFTAFISLNLAILNLLPFPALDGGRLFFLLIEVIIRRPIKPVIANTLNFIGFAILILLMIVITVSDVIKLF